MTQEVQGILKNAQRVHFIGIGGSGMFPLVQILHEKGYTITGSDVDDMSDIVRTERKMGIPVNVPHRADAVEGADAVVVSAALFQDNPEVRRAQELGIPIIKRSELLGYVTSLYSNAFCIAGTHGKTTTTSMLTEILYDAGRDPSAVIGGKLPAINAYGRYGHSQNFVCESCEYNNTFLHMDPDIAVVLNIDRDHLDFFGDLEHIQEAFIKFANKATRTVIYNGDDANTV